MSTAPATHAALCPLPATRARPGFALGEVVVTLALLSVGALALIGASAAAIRAISAAELQAIATAAARNRVEELSAIACASLRGGTAVDSSRAIHERWTVTTARNGARLVTDSVGYTDRIGHHMVVLQRLVVC